MSYLQKSFVFPVLFLASLSAAGCGAAPNGEREDADTADTTTAAASSAASTAPTLFFERAGGGFVERAEGALRKGQKARVIYDASRLATCRGEQGGRPQWSITGFYTLGSGPVRTFEAGGLSPSQGTAEATIDLDRAGDLAVWFQNTNRWGCSAYDSDFGRNYHFAVTSAPAANAPGYVGDARFTLDRMTCDGGPCESSRRPYAGPIVYETYARQRAAIRVFEFEVWKDGTTDRDNPDLWKDLDVQVHARVAADTGAAFASRYVSFAKRSGNNARYAIDLRSLDSVPGLGTLTDPAGCPAYPLSFVPGTNDTYVEAPVEFYVTVNGTELRPEGASAGAPTFVVRYQNYAGLYAPCITR